MDISCTITSSHLFHLPRQLLQHCRLCHCCGARLLEARDCGRKGMAIRELVVGDTVRGSTDMATPVGCDFAAEPWPIDRRVCREVKIRQIDASSSDIRKEQPGRTDPTESAPSSYNDRRDGDSVPRDECLPKIAFELVPCEVTEVIHSGRHTCASDSGNIPARDGSGGVSCTLHTNRPKMRPSRKVVQAGPWREPGGCRCL